MAPRASIETQAKTPPRVHYAFFVVVALTAINLAALGFARFSYSFILPAMKDNLGLSYAEAGLLGTGHLLGYTVGSLIVGLLTARYGTRFTSSLFIALAGIFTVLTGISNGFFLALIGRSLQGFGAGISNVAGLALVSAWFAPRRRGLALGIVCGGSGVGMMLAGWYIPGILRVFGGDGWRYSWYIMGAIIVVIGGAAYVLIRNRPQDVGTKPYGNDNASEEAILALSRSEVAVTSVYRMKSLWHVSAVYAIWGFAYVCYPTFFVAYLVGERKIDANYVTWLWTLLSVASIFAGFFWGVVSDYVGRRLALTLILAIQGASLLLIALPGGHELLFLSALLHGCSIAGMPVVISAATGDLVGGKLAPPALGFVYLAYGIAMALGPSFSGYIADVTHSFFWAFIISCGVDVIAILFAATLRLPEAKH